MCECETHKCDRDATIHRMPTVGKVPKEKKLCEPCFNAWESGAYTTGPGNYKIEQIKA